VLPTKPVEQQEQLNQISSLFYARQTTVRKFEIGDKSEEILKHEDFPMFVQQVNVIKQNNIYAALEKDH
jgi:hypothetical protein